ncbi:MAG: sigma-54-dependent transcriptional regulator [Aeoliella sp.]
MSLELPTPDDLSNELEHFRQTQALRRSSDCSLEVLVGESPAMVRLCAQVAAAVTSGANVLIEGPSGWELLEIAKTIHYRAHPGGDAPLVHLDGVAALSDDLRRSFSHSATGSAFGGSLLIESIDRLPPALQAELLAGMGKAEWQGQLLATQSVAEGEEPGEISDELRATISTISIAMPPLAERPEDLPLISQWYVEDRNRDTDKQVQGFSDDALDHLVLYDWPGELEELRAVIVRAHRTAAGPLITATDLPSAVQHALQRAQLTSDPPKPIDLDAYLGEVEGALVRRALELADGNKAEAARLLGVSRPRLYRKLEQMGLVEPAQSSQRKDKSSQRKEPAPVAGPDKSLSRDEIEFQPVDSDYPPIDDA